MTVLAASYPKLDLPEVLATLFHARKEPASPSPPNTMDLRIPVEGNIRLAASFYRSGAEDQTIMFFHGNGEIINDYDATGQLFIEAGLNFLVIDYRGYGASEGTPTVSNMISDTHAAFAYVSEWLREEGFSEALLVMGRSLGSACALEIAAQYQNEIAGLIIESGFATTLPLLQNLGIDTVSLGITEADGFNNVQKIACFAKPTFFIHAQHDQIISSNNAEILQVQSPARSKEFQIVPGADHNSIIAHAGKLYFATIKRFANKISGRKLRAPYRRKK